MAARDSYADALSESLECLVDWFVLNLVHAEVARPGGTAFRPLCSSEQFTQTAAFFHRSRMITHMPAPQVARSHHACAGMAAFAQ